MPDPRGGYPSSSTPVSKLPQVPTGPAPGASKTLARIRFPLPAVLHAREDSLVAEALCRCSQLFGRHAETCPSRVVVRDRRLSDALEAHDRRVLAADPETCQSCSQPLDPDNLCRVNGIGYHLGNCPQPHRPPDPALSIRCPICDAAPGEPCDPPPGIHVGRRMDHLHGKGSRT
jgi:hypothetical protein